MPKERERERERERESMHMLIRLRQDKVVHENRKHQTQGVREEKEKEMRWKQPHHSSHIPNLLFFHFFFSIFSDVYLLLYTYLSIYLQTVVPNVCDKI